jgi:hypothetical protein
VGQNAVGTIETPSEGDPRLDPDLVAFGVTAAPGSSAYYAQLRDAARGMMLSRRIRPEPSSGKRIRVVPAPVYYRYGGREPEAAPEPVPPLGCNPGFVYIISNRAWPGYYKVGRAENVRDRLATFQTGSPHRDYEVAYTVGVPDCVAAERFAHEALADSRREGEWFKASLTAIRRVLDKAKATQSGRPV